MTVIIYTVVAVLVAAQARAEVLDLSCSDNATCIASLTRELVRGIRQQKTVRLFDTITIEPVASHRQARSNQGAIAKFLSTHALSFDWNDYSFRFTKPASRSGVMELEVFAGRAVEEVEEEPTVTKKGEDKEEPKPKRRIIRRRHSKRILQALLPMLLGMKSASTAIIAISAVAVLTLKAFIASKLALLVTVGMAAKRLYESFGQGVGLQNHPYLYSQYPIDFPSASSHAYSVSGVSNPQFASPELFGATALASHSHQHEMLQQSDASAQQSQSAPTLQLANATRASERWDGKSRLLGLLRTAVDQVKSALRPLAGTIVGVMPASFRAITSKAFGWNTAPKEEELEDFLESRVPKAVNIESPHDYGRKQILVPKPRLLSRKSAELKSNRFPKTGPKKVLNKTMDLSKLKDNKDLNDYIKTKKYNYNYGYTHFYPRMKYFINQTTPHFALSKDVYLSNKHRFENNNLETPSYLFIKTTANSSPPFISPPSYRPFYQTFSRNAPPKQQMVNHRQKRELDLNLKNKYLSDGKSNINRNHRQEINNGRSISLQSIGDNFSRGLSDLLFNTNPVDEILKQVNNYVKSHTHPKKPSKMPLATTSQKIYYVGVEMVMFSLQMFDVYVNMAGSIFNHLTGEKDKKKKHKKGDKYRKKIDLESKIKFKNVKINKAYYKKSNKKPKA